MAEHPSATGGRDAVPPRVAESVLRVHAATLAEKSEVAFAAGPTVLAKLGESILRVAEANQVPMESGCRMGMCGADPIQVLAGEENLSPPSGAERATLRRLGLPSGCRMACTARLRGPVHISAGLDGRATAPAVAAPPAAATSPVAAGTGVRRVVVVGAGVAGVTAAIEFRRLDPDLDITLVGAESYDFYNRMTINNLVSESTAIDRLYLMPKDWAAGRNIRYQRGVTVRAIDAGEQRVITEDDDAIPYDRLLLATGARCYVPPIDGFGLAGSFVLRTIDDAVDIQQHIRRRRCRTAVVVGGGLLSLESAYSMSRIDVRVFVLDRAPWPLSRQLDQPGGALVWQMMSDLGITILPQTQARRVQGADRVRGVELLNGESLQADLCLVATGIQPDLALAASAGIATTRGVLVDDTMRTSNPAIFAAGDAMEHNGRLYGLWTAGVEQAQVAVVNILGGAAHYNGAIPPTKLKVAGIDMLSVGDIEARAPDDIEMRVDDGNARQYRKLVLSGGKLRGAIVIGHPDLFDRVSTAVAASLDVSKALADLERGDWSWLGE